MRVKDQSLPAILELDRVWVTADGRAKLLDFPAPGSYARPDQPGREAVAEAPAAGGGPSPHLFLSQVVASALAGRPGAAADSQSASVAVALPLHARALLGEMQAGLSPSLLADRLRPLLNMPAFVTRVRRLRVMVGCSVFPLAASMATVACGVALMQTRPEQPSNMPILSNPAVFIGVSAWPLVVLGAIPSLVTALLFRGGLILRTYGLAAVKKDGTKASRLRVFWRNLIAWFPALLSGPLLALLMGVGGGLLEGTPLGRLPAGELICVLSAWNFLSFMLTAFLVVWSALLPERGLQDRLAGTWLVPRE